MWLQMILLQTIYHWIWKFQGTPKNLQGPEWLMLEERAVKMGSPLTQEGRTAVVPTSLEWRWGDRRTGDDLESKQVKFIFLDSESRVQPRTDVVSPHKEFMPMLQTRCFSSPTLGWIFPRNRSLFFLTLEQLLRPSAVLCLVPSNIC